ncbi:YdaU family protein [Zhengella sp. ZM62]|uniref:YdaU family protein n=1 Tax=Zhengella sedimenti TaxID=3390035 RepID=UPI003976D66D
MTNTPFMQLYVADYLGDTMHLTTEQHGAYLLLLMTMWRHGGRLPNDPSKLARIARVSSRRWHMIADDVMEFFDIDGGEITQKRLVREHQKAVSISEKRSAIGKLGGNTKALKNNKTRMANAKQMPKHSQIPDTIKGIEANASCPEPEKSAPVACRLPLVSGDDFVVLESDVLEWSESFPAVDVRQQLLAMRAWLNANQSKRKTARGIKRFIVSWLDREQNRPRAAPLPRQGQPPPQDSFQAAIQRRLSQAHEPDRSTERHDDTGNGRADFAGSGPVVDLLAVSRRV